MDSPNNTPITTAADQPVTEQLPAKVTFSPEQQSTLNRVIKEVSARAGAEARAEASRLTLELDALRAASPQESDTEIRTRLAVTERERDSLKQANSEASVMQLLRTAAGDSFVDTDLACQLLRQNVKVIDGKPVVTSQDGSPALNALFEPLTLQEAVVNLMAAKPFLARGTVKGGIGALPSSSPVFQSESVAIHKLWGPNGDVEARNKIAINSPNLYRELRRAAKSAGLVY